MSKLPQKLKPNELIRVLQNSLYIGAKTESVMMVIEYCNAAGLDVMQKPVHIVPMNVKDPTTGRYEWKDIVMPGIGLYRIQADRSETMAGISEPEFGPTISTQKFFDKNNNPVNCEFPEWCKVTVQKLVKDRVVDFMAKEYWLENYATDSGKSDAPNMMWRKRPRGQLAKCAEAQALRKAWPEIGAAPTAEEMEGKIIDMGNAEVITDDKPKQAPELPAYTESEFLEKLGQWRDIIDAGKSTPDRIIAMVSNKVKLTANQIEEIKKLGNPAPAQETTLIDTGQPDEPETDQWVNDYNNAEVNNNANY